MAARDEMGQRVLHPCELGLGARRDAVRPARVVRQLVVAPVAVAVRRIGQDGVDGETGEGVGAETVADTHLDVRLGRGEHQAHRAALRLHRNDVLAVQRLRTEPRRRSEQ